MPSRLLPRSVMGLQNAMQDGKSKATTSPEHAIDPATMARLNAFLPEYIAKIQEMEIALRNQTTATAEETEALNICRIFVSHYFQVLNLGIARGVYADKDRNYYGISVNDSKVPSLGKENEVIFWAEKIISGDAARLAAGGAPMTNPTAEEVSDKLTIYRAKRDVQSQKKDEYDNAQQAVGGMFETAKQLVVDMWDEVEFYFRHEPDEASKRRKCREWGVVYVSDNKGKIIGKVTDFATNAPLEGVTVKLIETEDTTLTNANGDYDLSTKLMGTGTLEYTLEGYAPSVVTVELHENGTLVQDAKMKLL